jgi:threonine aldolase
MMKTTKGFASDNYAGAHPKIIEALQRVNQGHAGGYGNDEYTKTSIKRIKEVFGKEVEPFFVYSGMGANILGLTAISKSINSIICAETAHINVDECGGPEKYTGCKVVGIRTNDGKLTPELIKNHLYNFGDQHRSQPRVVSITQATELGTIYTAKEIKAIAETTHKLGMLLHMDGARIANAAEALNSELKDITFSTGVDVLSFGISKNGGMFGEAVIFANKELSKDFQYIRKQGMQLHSKMRFISAQFEAMLTNDLWRENAKHANQMAKLLEKEITGLSRIKITQKVQTNGVFAIIPREWIEKLQKEYFFYVWNEKTCEVRWMCSFDTTREDIEGLVSLIKNLK